MIDVLDYRRPNTFDELWAAFDEAEAPLFISAGCTDLIPKNRAGAIPPGTWIDIRQIEALRGIHVDEASIRFGACVTHSQVASFADDIVELEALALACASVGSRQIRSLGTLGGNAANCSPCADSLLALAALDADVVIHGPAGTRTVAATDLPRGPGETMLEAREIIEAFVVPRRKGRRSSFLKLGPRKAVAVAKVSASASAVIEEGKLRDVRLALGSVAPTLIRVEEAETLLEGAAVDEATLARVAQIAAARVKPIDDARSTANYRRHTAGILAKRAIANLVTPKE